MPDPRPNILWICTDSQRWDSVGHLGNRHVRTPHLDRLAREGVAFERAYCQNPLCMPSRGSFLTGRYPSTNRLRQNGQTNPGDLRLVTATLADAGYDCGLVGKLHLANCDRRLELGPDWPKHPREEWRVPFEARGRDGYDFFAWDHGSDGHPASAYSRWLAERGVDPVPAKLPHPLSDKLRVGRPAALHQTLWGADQTIGFINERASAARPWLLSLNLFDPHPDFDPPDEFLAPYLDRLEEIGTPPFDEAELDRLPAYQKDRYLGPGGRSTRGWSRRDLGLVRAAYYAMVDQIDHHLGRILAALAATGQAGRTLILFHSDHGELLGDHGQTWKGPCFYEGSMRVPLVFHWPARIPGGRRARGLVELTDLAPTLLSAAGLPRDPGMQGLDLWSRLLDPADPLGTVREDVYAEYGNANPAKSPIFLSMVRDDRYKLVAVHTTLEGELYDLETDPGEHLNLWDSPEHTAVKLRLLQRLCARQAFTADPLPLRVGVY
jgi:arylsulfatase A-like enzyme